MRIDNSAMKIWFECPAKYQERYVHEIEPKSKTSSALTFGKVFHALLEKRLKNEPVDEALWDAVPQEIREEAEYTYEKYCQQYPVETWETIDVERLVEVPLGTGQTGGRIDGGDDPDIYVAKMDWVVCAPEGLRIIDHKTEERGSVNNSPQRWQFLTQVSLYQWAAEQYYHEPIYNIVVDIITRRSTKGRCDPEFSRLEVHRSPWQQQQALETLRYVVAQIKAMQATEWTDGLWPQNRENCQKWRIPCEYVSIHGEEGRDENILRVKFREAEKYLDAKT